MISSKKNIIVLFVVLLLPKLCYCLEIAPIDLRAVDKNKIAMFVGDTLKLLPEKLKKNLIHQVQLTFKNFNGTEEYIAPSCDKPSKTIYGHYSKLRNQITLDLTLLDAVNRGRDDAVYYGCKHRDSYKHAQATLLHEIFHLFDHKGNRIGNEKNNKDFCDKNYRKTENHHQKKIGATKKKYHGPCQYLNGSTKFSESPTFRALASPYFRSTNNVRSMDLYEKTSYAELFAVNFEYFILDSNYKCRRPLLFQYYADLFEYQPYPNESCQVYSKIPLLSQKDGQSSVELIDLSPEQVIGISYMFAGKGSSWISKWGHAGFEIKTCSKFSVDGECVRQKNYIMSFMANINESVMSLRGGINGQYDSMLLFEPQESVVHRYNHQEMRDIYFLPMNLTLKQKKDFLLRTIEYHWSYRGSYKFLTNNCADELLTFLKGVFTNDLVFLSRKTNTPFGLLNILENQNNFTFRPAPISVDITDSANELELLRKSYLLQGKHSITQRTFEYLHSINVLPKEVTLKTYSKLTHHELKEKIKIKLPELSRAERVKMRFSYLMMEDFRAAQVDKEFKGDLFRISLNDQDKNSLDQKINHYKDLSLPESLLSTGYGVPTVVEIQSDVIFNLALESRTQMVEFWESIYQKNTDYEELKFMREQKDNEIQEFKDFLRRIVNG